MQWPVWALPRGSITAYRSYTRSPDICWDPVATQLRSRSLRRKETRVGDLYNVLPLDVHNYRGWLSPDVKLLEGIVLLLTT